MSKSFDLSGRVAMITGANAGIGRAIALALAEAGADIVAVGRSSCEETVAQVMDLGRRAQELRADLSTAAPVRGLVDDTVSAFGRLDILVNNAGIIRRSPALDFSEADWDAVMGTNLKSKFFLSQAAGRRMIENGGGRIINIASVLSFQGGVNVASYATAKAGLANLTRLLANEWASKGVNVNAIAPGYVRTSVNTALQADPDRYRSIVERIPAGRWGEPSDIGGAAVFLASDAAAYVHGAILPVDGGWLAR